MGSARRFNLVRELGSGAFGTVYLAEMESLGGFRKEVALKLLRSEVGEGSDAGRRLRDEARLLGRLRHRHIVQVDDLIRLDGRWAVVMEHVPGQDLEAVVSAADKLGEVIPPLAAIEVARAIALALDSAFNGTGSQGEPLKVVHRDIKPSNVRITPDGEVRVLDFGIARADFGEREAKTGMVRYGSVAYMSPERLLGEPETPAGDVYALGCVLYELIVGKGLGRAELAPNRHVSQLTAVRVAVVARLEGTEAASIAEDLARLIVECLAYDVGGRPSAASIAERLRALGRGVHGADLATFTRGFLPRVRGALGDDSRVVEGTLVEELITGTVGDSDVFESSARRFGPSRATDLGAVMGTASAPKTSAPTLVAPEEPAAPPPRAGSGPMIGAAVVAAIAVVGIALALFRPPAEPPPPEPAAVVGPQPAPAEPPPVEAAPVEAAPVEPAPVDATPETQPAGGPSPAPQSGKSPPPTRPEPEVVEPPPAQPAPDAPRLRAAKFAVAGADMVSATCGDRSGSGLGSALVRDFPSGPCAVQATIGGREFRTELNLDSARGVECALEGERFQCR